MDRFNPIKNRWFVVIGAILVQLALGTLYSWSTVSVFATPYIQVAEPYITKEITVYIFGVSLLAFAVAMIFAGQLQQKIGPKKVAIIGGITLGAGVILSAITAGSFIGLLITYGIVFGVGIGFAYVCPIACAAKWFPDKKGFINGIAVAGFGAGSFIFNYVIRALGFNVPLMFIVIGIIYLVMVVVGALTLINPPEGWKPEGWTAPPASIEDGVSGLELTRKEMIKTKSFLFLWLAFLLSAICGLMTIGAYGSFAKSLPSGQLINDATFIATVGALAALFNGLGRIAWGTLSDKIFYKKSMIIMFSIQAILMMIVFFTAANAIAFLIVVCLIYFCFGGNFSMFPTATADLFGSKNLGPNYGIVFTAYGIAGFAGATLVNFIVAAFGGIYLALFIVMGIMSIGATAIAFILKPPNAE